MIKRGVFRIDPVTSTWISDPEGWQFELFGLWLACFGAYWRGSYPSTWAVAFGRGETLFYEPRRRSYGH